MVESATFEKSCTERYRRFESCPLRLFQKTPFGVFFGIRKSPAFMSAGLDSEATRCYASWYQRLDKRLDAVQCNDA